MPETKPSLLCIGAGLLAIVISPALAQESRSDAICAGLTGAAHGLCQAAVVVGCDGTRDQAIGCTNIETRYTELTGDPTPPWTSMTCPCGTAADFANRAGTKDVVCHVESVAGDSVIKLDLNGIIVGSANVVFSAFPGAMYKQTCGFADTSYYTITDPEAETCVAEVRAAALMLQTKCP